jgi:hypothetical protein
MRAGLLCSAAVALTLAAPSAEPAVRPPRFLLAAVAGGSVSLYESSDGVRFDAAPGYSPRPGQSAAAVRRGSAVYLYDTPALSADGLVGSIRRFAIGSSGQLAEQAAGSYEIGLASTADAARASAGSFAPAVAVDDAGSIVLLYAIRFEPGTNACPIAGQACVKLRTATEVAGSGGTSFTGDPGNRLVLSFPATDAVGAPSLLRSEKGWSVLAEGPSGCLRVLTATDPHGSYRNAGCVSDSSPATPSGIWDARLREYRLYGVAGGKVVRAVTGRLNRLAASRFRAIALPASPTAVRIAPNAP